MESQFKKRRPLATRRNILIGLLTNLLVVTVVRSDPSADTVSMKAASITKGGDGVAVRWTIKQGWLPDGGFNLYRSEEGSGRILLNQSPLGASSNRGNAKAWMMPTNPGSHAIDYKAALKAAANSDAKVDEKQVRLFSETPRIPPPSATGIFEAIGRQLQQLRHTAGPSLPSNVAEMQIRKDPLIAPYMDKLHPAVPPQQLLKKPTLYALPNPGGVKAPSTATGTVDPVRELRSIRQNLLAGAFIHRDLGDGLGLADDLGLAFDDKTAKSKRSYQYELHTISGGKEDDKAVAMETIASVGEDTTLVPSGLLAHQLDADKVALRWDRPNREQMAMLGMTSYEVFRSSGSDAPAKVSRRPIVVADMMGKDGIVEPIHFFKDQKVPVGACSYKLVQTDMFGRKTESAILSFTMEDWFMPAAPTMAQAELKDDNVTVTWRDSVLESGTPDADVQYRIYREDIEQEAEQGGYNKVDHNNSSSSKVIASPDAISKSAVNALFTPKGGGLFRSPVGADWQLLTTTSVKGERFTSELAKTFPGGRLARAMEKSTGKKSSRSDDWLHYVDHNAPKDHKYRYFVTAAYPKNDMETTATGTSTLPVPSKVAPPPPANLKTSVEMFLKGSSKEPVKVVESPPRILGDSTLPARNQRAKVKLAASVPKGRQQDTGAIVTLNWDPVAGTAPLSYRVYRASASGLKETKDNKAPAPAAPKKDTAVFSANLSGSTARFQNYKFQMPPATLGNMSFNQHTYHYVEDFGEVEDSSYVFLGEIKDATTFTDEIPRSQSHRYIYRVIAVNRWGVPAGGPHQGIKWAQVAMRVPASLAPSAPGVISAVQDPSGYVDVKFRPNLEEEHVTFYEIRRYALPPPAPAKTMPAKDVTAKGSARFGIRSSGSVMTTLHEKEAVVSSAGQIAKGDLPNPYKPVGTVNALSVSDGVLSFTDKDIAPNREYSYYVVAVDHDDLRKQDLRARSGSVPCTTDINPDYTGPAKLTPIASCNAVKLNWPAATDATHYIVERSLKSLPAGIVQLSGLGSDTSYVDHSVQSGETYSYRVRGVTVHGYITDPATAEVTVPTK